MDLNNWNGIGRLTKDPEQRQAGETNVANFSIAVNGWKDNVSFINITVFGKLSDLCQQYLKKGEKGRSASIEVVHTCSVTGTAASKSRHALRQAGRRGQAKLMTQGLPSGGNFVITNVSRTKKRRT